MSDNPIPNPELRYGPQTGAIEALIERIRALTAAEHSQLDVIADSDQLPMLAAQLAALDSGRESEWNAAVQDAASELVKVDDLSRSFVVSMNAVMGLIVKDVISSHHYAALTDSWESIIGLAHPDDAIVSDNPIPTPEQRSNHDR